MTPFSDCAESVKMSYPESRNPSKFRMVFSTLTGWLVQAFCGLGFWCDLLKKFVHGNIAQSSPVEHSCTFSIFVTYWITEARFQAILYFSGSPWMWRGSETSVSGSWRFYVASRHYFLPNFFVDWYRWAWFLSFCSLLQRVFGGTLIWCFRAIWLSFPQNHFASNWIFQIMISGLSLGSFSNPTRTWS